MANAEPPTSPPPPAARRNDLDALRAFAMLLGIVLHAGLSFTPFPWPVQDTQQSPLVGLMFAAIHGFRMPLFFLVSGFFTAMLWNKRGPQALLRHRAMRILLPCLLGLATIVPLTDWSIKWAMGLPRAEAPDDGSLVSAIRAQDVDRVRSRLESGADANEPDTKLMVTPLSWAAIVGDAEIVRALVESGADLAGRNGDGGTALHGAAFFGRVEAAQVLIERGADPDAKNNDGYTPRDALDADWAFTQGAAGFLRVAIGSEEEVQQGRSQVREVFADAATDQPDSAAETPDDTAASTLLDRYDRFLNSDVFNVAWSGGTFNLMNTPVFHHLWFLWFLCWLVPIFAVLAWGCERLRVAAPPAWLVVTPACLLWLLPVTLLPQWFMGRGGPSFGPDTSIGVLPYPHLLLYYAVFFLFGAIYFNNDDESGRLTRWWGLAIPLALVAFVVGLGAMGNRPVTSLAQVFYAWAMTFALMGLFRRFLPSENRAIRYVSDSSYWLYVAHLPLVIVAQAAIRNWRFPLVLKYALLCAAVTLILLATYQTLVRYTWLGVLLNGPRKRPAAPAVAA